MGASALSIEERHQWAIRLLTDRDGIGDGLEASREVRDLARHQEFAGRSARGHRLTGRHADPEGEANAILLLEQRIELRHGVAHRDRGPDRSLGVVLVDRGHAEDRHHSVPRELLDGAVERFDSLPHLLEEGREERAQCLGVVARRELRRSRDVREEDGDELPLVARHSARIVA